MDNPDCSLSCLMKRDLQSSSNKLALLQDNWPSFFDQESISKLSESELRCSLCLIEVIIDALVKDEYFCPGREVIQLVTLRTYIENITILRELKQMKDELVGKYPEENE